MPPVISPSVIPFIPAGSLFNRLTTDTTFNVRWITEADPVFYEVQNRPCADLDVQLLIVAKAVDNVGLRMSHNYLFPFLIVPKLNSGSLGHIELPAAWIWDLHVSLPQKWEYVRLAKIKRLNGVNGGSAGGYTGQLRLIFTAQIKGSITEVAVFRADFTIDSVLDYQISRIVVPATGEEPVTVAASETSTIDGFIEFRSLDDTDPTVRTMYDALPPGGGSGSSGEMTLEIVDGGAPGGSADEQSYSAANFAHGTGLLTSSAYNLIPVLDSNPNIWLESFNYPFRIGASRQSMTPASSPITIPKAIFSEFDICAPVSDQPTGDTSGAFCPVWVNRIERMDGAADSIKFIFATFNITLDQQSTVPVEFAELTLSRSGTPGTVVEIKEVSDLLMATGTSASLAMQGFGRGHAVLSDKWGGSTSEIDDFFDAFIPITDSPPAAIYTDEATHLSALAVSRSPRNIPNDGQYEALLGTSARRVTPIVPSDANRFVTEQDSGIGDQVDFSAATSPLPPAKRDNPDINRYGYKGGLVSPLITLVINSAGTVHNYDDDILPRLIAILGRPPQHGDRWLDGTRIKTFVVLDSSPGVWIG
jgi:hypothetical protein